MLLTDLKKKIKLASRFRCCRPPGPLWTGKKSDFLFEELQVNLLNKICIFMDVIIIFAEKF